MTKNITAYGFRKALVDAIATKPEGEDYRYVQPTTDSGQGMCRYTEPNGLDLAPSCLIGVALTKLGVSVGQLYDVEGTTAMNVVEKFLNVPNIVARAARRAQEEQDSGQTWGDALKAYDQFLMDRETAAPSFPDAWKPLGFTVQDDLIASTQDAIKKASGTVKGIKFADFPAPTFNLTSYYDGAVKAAL